MPWIPKVGDDVVIVGHGTDNERVGRVVDDFGERPAHAVDVGETRIAEPARRFAIHTDDGDLVFLDADNLAPTDHTQTPRTAGGDNS